MRRGPAAKPEPSHAPVIAARSPSAIMERLAPPTRRPLIRYLSARLLLGHLQRLAHAAPFVSQRAAFYLRWSIVCTALAAYGLPPLVAAKAADILRNDIRCPCSSFASATTAGRASS